MKHEAFTLKNIEVLKSIQYKSFMGKEKNTIFIAYLNRGSRNYFPPFYVMDKISGDIHKKSKRKEVKIMDDILAYHVQKQKKRLDVARGKSLRHFLGYLKTENPDPHFQVEDEDFRILITVKTPFTSRIRKNLSTTYCKLDQHLGKLFFEVVDPTTQESIRFIYKLTEIVDKREYFDKDE